MPRADGRLSSKQRKRCAHTYVSNARVISKTYTGKRARACRCLPAVDLAALVRIAVPLCVAACVIVHLL